MVDGLPSTEKALDCISGTSKSKGKNVRRDKTRLATCRSLCDSFAFAYLKVKVRNRGFSQTSERA